MANPAPTINQINAFNATQGTTIDFNIIGGTELVRSNRIYIYDLSDNSLICTHLYVSTESIHELPANTDSSIVYESGKSSADFVNGAQYYAQIQTFTDIGGTEGGSGLSVAKMFWCLVDPTLTIDTIPSTISTTSYNVSATYNANTSVVSNIIQQYQFSLYSATGSLLQSSGVVVGNGEQQGTSTEYDISYNFSGLSVGSSYYIVVDVTTTQGMSVSTQSGTFTVSIDTPTLGEATVVNNACDGYISVTSNLSGGYEYEESAGAGEIMSFTTDSVNDITELDVDFSPVQDDTPWMSAQDTEPYMFRAVPTQTEDFGHESDTIIGGTVAWNQLALLRQTEYTPSSIGVTYTPISESSFRLHGTITAINDIYLDSGSGSIPYVSGHKYITWVSGSASASEYFKFHYGTKYYPDILNSPYIIEATGSRSYDIETLQTGEVDFTFHWNKIDLTQMFGSTIADYIYSLEQATAGAGVAWFKSLFPKPYYAYNAGELMSVNASEHVTVGFNQWDEEWETGRIELTTGDPAYSATRIRSKNFIPCIPNTGYYWNVSGGLLIAYYDCNKNFISGTWQNAYNTYITPTNAFYMKFNTGDGYGGTYNNDICINISDADKNGTYEAYDAHTYALDESLTLRGIPKLDANNKLYYDGDTYESDGTVTRKYGIVDLGTLVWYKVTSGGATFFYAELSNGSRASDFGGVCAKYPISVGSTWASNDKACRLYGSEQYAFSRIGILDSAYTSGDANAFKTAMSGVYLVYELATPTTELADPYTNPQIVDPSGTEEYVGSSIPVGHETTYQRICPIDGWSQVDVTRCGKNLFSGNLTNGYYDVADGSLVSSSSWRATDKIRCDASTAYIMSGTSYSTGGYNGAVLFWDSNNNYISYFGAGTTFTTPANAYYMAFYLGASYATNTIQVELGSIATTYEAYTGTTYTSTFPKYKQQVTQDTTPYITKNIGDTYADTLTENLVGGTVAWNQSVPDTTTTHTVSGSIASMDDAVAGNFASVVCDIDAVQSGSGDPSPNNVCPITGWSAVNVTRTGKNLFDKNATDTNNGYNAGRYLNYGGDTSTNGGYNVSEFIPIKAGGTYTIQGVSGNNPSYCLYDKNKTYITGSKYANASSITFTAPTNAEYLQISIPTSTIDSIQIETGSSATDYEAYTTPTTYTTSLGNTYYGGTLDMVSGVLTVTHGYYDMGSLNWQKDVSFFYVLVSDKANNANCISSIYPNVGLKTDSEVINGSDKVMAIGANNAKYILIKDTSYASASDFITAVTGQELVYELATPTTVQLTPQQINSLLGTNNVWNNISDTSVTYPTNHSYQSLSTTHKYYERINGVESISVGSDVVVDVGTDNIIDLTQMFGTTIADYIYNIEQSSSSGMGVKFFKSLFPSDDYDYNSGELISVKASAHVIKDANGNVVHTYPLDSDLVLRGMPKLDANNKLYYDGDVYEPDGNVTRKYGIVDLGTLNYNNANNNLFYSSTEIPNFKTVANWRVVANMACAKYTVTYGDDTAAGTDKTISAYGVQPRIFIKDTAYNDSASLKPSLNGVYLVYELATPTTETADPFEENQTIISNGIEEYTVTEQGDVEMPVGHDSTYYATEIYGGTIDMASGVLTMTHKVVDLGSLNWGASSAQTGMFYTTELRGIIQNNATDVLCSYYTLVGSISASTDFVFSVDTIGTVYVRDTRFDGRTAVQFKSDVLGVQLVYPLATPIEISLTPQQMQTLSGQNNIWSNTNGGMYLVYRPPITSLLVKRRDVADVSGKWLTLYSTPITQASDMDFTFIDFLNQYGKTYQYALVPVLAQEQSGVVVQIEGGYTVSDNVDSIFDGVYIADQTNVERVKAGVGYGNIDMNQGVGSITPIGSKYPIVITNSQNQYHNGSIRGTIVPNDFYSNGNLSRIDMVNKRDELEQFLTNKRAKIIKDWNGKMWLVMIMDNIDCSFDNNYGMGIVTFNANWLEVGDPTNQEDLQATGLVDVGGV